MKSYIMIICILLTIIGCNKCRDYTLCDFSDEANKYFEVYREGNWWVYENQNKSKKDSLYVIQYYNYTLDKNKDKNSLSKKDCTKYKQIINVVSSNYLGLEDEINITYMTIPDYCSISSFKILVDYKDYSFTYDKNSNGFTNGIINNVLVLHNGDVYSNVVSDTTNTFFLAKNVGIVRYIINSDTFDLKNYQIN